jgi:hypothetical protein
VHLMMEQGAVPPQANDIARALSDEVIG